MALSEELAAREQRTLGVFTLMFGAGALLDDASVRLGSFLLLIGAVLFAKGLLGRRHLARSRGFLSSERHDASLPANPEQQP